jgi:hypothetical protein
MKTEIDEPAFPSERPYYGMSLRDYFAAHAPPPPNWWMEQCKTLVEAANQLTAWSSVYADAMLEARKK